MKRSKLEWMVNRELKRIQENVPQELIEKLIKKEKVAPDIKTVVEKALAGEGGEITEEQRTRFEAILASGVLDQEIEVIDHDVENALDAWFSAEIAYAVKVGRLPKEAPSLALRNNKGKKYVRKQAKRLKELFSTEGSDDGDEARDDLQHPVADSERGSAGEDVSLPDSEGSGQGEARQAAAQT